MKNSFLRKALSALFVVAFSGSMAQAETYVHIDVIYPFNLTGVGTEDPYFQWYHLGDSFPGALIGDSIVEDITFVTLPGYSTLHVSALSDMHPVYYDPSDTIPNSWDQEVQMLSIKLFELPVASDAIEVAPFSSIVDPTFASGVTTAPLNSGAYYIELTALVVGADQTPSFTGAISDTPLPFPTDGGSVAAVPEPTTGWLLALGLAGVGLAGRHRARQRNFVAASCEV